ncbi:MAG: lipopolysaccharide biosynthesis protein [Mesorhizobium sp.]|nr:MAG: lipopolysaccharide biosynthesis protein [Mesorhizobium sp.]
MLPVASWSRRFPAEMQSSRGSSYGRGMYWRQPSSSWNGGVIDGANRIMFMAESANDGGDATGDPNGASCMANTEDSNSTTKPRKLTERMLKGAAWSGVTSIARLGLKFISVAILARLLSPRDYGVVGGAVIAVELAAMLYGLGLAQALIQRKVVERDHIATALGVSLTLSCVIGAALWLAAPFVAALMRIEALTDVVKLLAFTTPLGAFNLICEALLVRNMRIRAVSLRPLFSFSVAVFVVAVPMAFAGFGYWSLVAMQIAEVSVGALAFGVAARKLLVLPGFSARAFRELWPMSLGFSLTQPFGYLVNNTPKFLIARLMGAEALGLFTRAAFLSENAGHLFNGIVRIVAFPAMAQLQNDRERLRSGYLKGLSLTALATIPTSAFSIVFAQELVDIMLGPRWDEAVLPFALLATSLYFRLGNRVSYAVLQALGQPYRIIKNNCAVVAILALGILTTSDHGLASICTVVLLAFGAAFVITVRLVSRVMEMSIGAILRTHVMPMSLALVVVAIGVGTKAMLVGQSSIVIVAISALAVVNSVLALLYFLPEKTLVWFDVEGVRTLPSLRFAFRQLARHYM